MDSLPVAQDGRVAIALVDEPAHLSTALIVLFAVGGPGSCRGTVRSPSAQRPERCSSTSTTSLVRRCPHISLPGGRPYSTRWRRRLLLLLAVAVCRVPGLCLSPALGMLLHFVRDIATGPGLPLVAVRGQQAAAAVRGVLRRDRLPGRRRRPAPYLLPARRRRWPRQTAWSERLSRRAETCHWSKWVSMPSTTIGQTVVRAEPADDVDVLHLLRRSALTGSRRGPAVRA